MHNTAFFFKQWGHGEKTTSVVPKGQWARISRSGLGRNAEGFARALRMTPLDSRIHSEANVEKPYSWVAGAVLEEHSRRKHKVIANTSRDI